ncbi:glycerophosphodiester phosphodiesterase GDPD6 [Selaginella moellendorffii]|uniref:glycerophosphodiester phosphodiesterase GDPD6 n=1 Tax=Selaginella moellendorffii TaxID=88036 RepID=UPI000D1C4DAE|nr:glycerophosphodiester phosphodiesterase GDPD6 [Selaginella moellendorffii]|eukprot:XP_024538713.1 glycerophosphodiester phosphodiesterase GDPD6 [Selaginella moellendorffii]
MGSTMFYVSLLLLLLLAGSDCRVFQFPFQTNEPYNIAHRGSSGEFPEESVLAYKRAIEEGADFIEADITATKDGKLICFHDLILDSVTDVHDHPEFASRKQTYVVDGVNVTGYFAVDFTLEELKSLRLIQRYPNRDQSYNGKLQIPTFEEFIAIALASPKSERVGIYVEIKSPTFINHHVKWSEGRKFEDVFLNILKKYDYNAKYLTKEWLDKPVFIQSFDPSSLIYLHNKTSSPKILLIAPDSITSDTKQTYEEIISDDYLDYISKIVVGIGPAKEAIAPVDSNNKLLPMTDLVDKAHARGLEVHPWTFNHERNLLLPFDYHQDPYREYDMFVNTLEVDGVFTDSPESFETYRRQWRIFSKRKRPYKNE